MTSKLSFNHYGIDLLNLVTTKLGCSLFSFIRRNEMNSRNYQKILNKTCVWLGLSSIHFYFRENSLLRNLLLFLPIFVQISIIIIEFYISTAYHYVLFHQTSMISALTDALQVAGTLLASAIHISENLFKGRLDSHLREQMEKIDCELLLNHISDHLPDCTLCQKLKLKRFFVVKLISLFIFGLIIDVFIMTTIKDDEKVWRQNICVRGWSNNMIRIGLLQIIFSFGWISSRLNFVRMELEECLQLAASKVNKGNEIARLKGLYSQLWTFKHQLNERYNWTLFAVLVVYFCSICVGLYWVLMRIQFHKYRTMGRKKQQSLHFEWKNSFEFISEAVLLHCSSCVTIATFICEVEAWKYITKQILKSVFVCRKTDDLFISNVSAPKHRKLES